MIEQEYKEKYYPQDFILINNNFYPLPKGGKLQIQQKEVASTFTTADGTKRKDIIRKYESVSVKFSALLELDLNAIKKIIQEVEHFFNGDRKILCIKKEAVAVKPLEVLSSFHHIKIDTISPIKYTYVFRKNGLFVYSGITININ